MKIILAINAFFYNDEKCYFPCMNKDRDDNNQVIYKDVRDE